MEVDSSFEIAPKLVDKEFKRPLPVRKTAPKKPTESNNTSESSLKRVTFSDFARDNHIVVIVFAVIIVLLICVILYFAVLKDKLESKEKGAVLPIRNPQYPPPGYRTPPYQYGDPRMMAQQMRDPRMMQHPSQQFQTTPETRQSSEARHAQEGKPTEAEKNAHLDDILAQTAGLDTDDEIMSDSECENETNKARIQDLEPSENEDTIENAINAIELVD